MRKIKTLLVEDEREALQGLKAYLAECCGQVEVCGEALSVSKAVKLCRQHSPDLVFLDIEMPGGNGFELLKLFGNAARPEIIFTTAHEHYAIRALREGASDYLLKPIDIDELKRAVQKAEERLNGKTAIFPVLPSKLRILTNNGMQFISQREVLLIEADGRYSIFHLAEGKTLVTAKNIGRFEEELYYKGFFRVHKSYLINCEHISLVAEGTNALVVLSDKRTIEIARRKRTELQDYLKLRTGRV